MKSRSPLSAIVRLALAVAAGVTSSALSGCGGGGGSPSSPPGSGGGALTFTQRDAAMTAVSDTYAALPHQDLKSDNQALFNFVQTRSEFDASGYVEKSGTIWAHFRGGQMLLIINNRPYSETTRAVNVPNLPTPPSRPLKSAGRGVPFSSAILFNNTTLLDGIGVWGSASATQDNLKQSLTQAGYTVKTLPGTLDNLANASAASFGPNGHGGDSIIYAEGHGTFVLPPRETLKDGTTIGGIPFYALRSSVLVNPTDDATWDADLKAGNVGPALTPGFDAGRYLLGKNYYVTDKFIAKYWHLDPQSSMVFLNTCLSNGELNSSPMRDAAKQAGAQYYVGWTQCINAGAAATAARYLVNSLAGTNLLDAPKSPPARPFDINLVLDDMNKQKLDLASSDLNPSDDPNAILVASDLSNGGGTGALIFTPSISHLVVDDTTNVLTINGKFGPEPGQVTINGKDLPLVGSWNDTQIKCSLPPRGADSFGQVVVTVNGHASNTVTLTRWDGKVTVLAEWVAVGSLQYTVEYDLSFRGDVHNYRNGPSSAPLLANTTAIGGQDSLATYWATGSGSETSNGITVSYQYTAPRADAPMLLLPNLNPAGLSGGFFHDPGPTFDGFSASATMQMVPSGQSGSLVIDAEAYLASGIDGLYQFGSTDTLHPQKYAVNLIASITGTGHAPGFPITVPLDANGNGAAGAAAPVSYNGWRYTVSWTAFSAAFAPNQQTSRADARRAAHRAQAQRAGTMDR